MLARITRLFAVAALFLVVGVLPVLAEGIDDSGVYAVDLKVPTGLADTSTILADGDITADVVVAETSDGVYWVDIKLPLVLFEGLYRLQVLGLDIDVSVE